MKVAELADLALWAFFIVQSVPNSLRSLRWKMRLGSWFVRSKPQAAHKRLIFSISTWQSIVLVEKISWASARLSFAPWRRAEWLCNSRTNLFEVTRRTAPCKCKMVVASCSHVLLSLSPSAWEFAEAALHHDAWYDFVYTRVRGHLSQVSPSQKNLMQPMPAKSQAWISRWLRLKLDTSWYPPAAPITYLRHEKECLQRGHSGLTHIAQSQLNHIVATVQFQLRILKMISTTKLAPKANCSPKTKPAGRRFWRLPQSRIPTKTST